MRRPRSAPRAASAFRERRELFSPESAPVILARELAHDIDTPEDWGQMRESLSRLHTIEQTVASGLIYLNSHARDFQNPEMRPYLDRYLRGSNGYKAEERGKLMKLLWDTIATEFGGRHELYEINYGGSTEEIPRYCLFGAQASGNAEKFKGFAEECMAEYDLEGWRVPDLADPGELSYHLMRDRK